MKVSGSLLCASFLIWNILHTIASPINSGSNGNSTEVDNNDSTAGRNQQCTCGRKGELCCIYCDSVTLPCIFSCIPNSLYWGVNLMSRPYWFKFSGNVLHPSDISEGHVINADPHKNRITRHFRRPGLLSDGHSWGWAADGDAMLFHADSPIPFLVCLRSNTQHGI